MGPYRGVFPRWAESSVGCASRDIGGAGYGCVTPVVDTLYYWFFDALERVSDGGTS